ncbi:MAG: helix-turn-helix transcriptional regulator [Lentisphaeria bacterium]|nr:helix-turn-helix transcriptional regulator [Lentisphaeria bacterium]
MTQRKLSYLSGVHRVSIARYETGRVSPTVRVLEKLADALGVPIDEIIGRRAG